MRRTPRRDVPRMTPRRSAPEMVEDNRGIRERPREIRQIGDVRVIDPPLERQAVPAQIGVASPEAWIQEHMLREIGRLGGNHRTIRPRRAVTDAAKRCGLAAICASSTGRLGRPGEGRRCRRCRRRPASRRPAARAHRRDALHELGFANHFELVRPVGTVHRRALDEHRLSHIVRPGVGHELIEQVPVARPIPQVVVRIDDRKPRLERGLVGQRQPVLRLGPCCADASFGATPPSAPAAARPPSADFAARSRRPLRVM